MNKKTLAWVACLMVSLVSGMQPALAQNSYPAYPPPPPSYSQEQLDQLLAPVALYPDPLLAQVLMASTYPLEVVQAQRFVEARPGLQGDGLARAVAPMPWDPSVKALVQFPSVLAMMNDRLDWMQQLGQAFLAQQDNVMDTVQQLRGRAQVAGTLQSGPQQRVLVEDEVIMIEPVNPQLVYVPYYNPVVAYGTWWWPQRPPVVWAPPPRYRPPQYSPGVTVGISFGTGVGILRATFGDARPDWRQHQVMVTQTRIHQVTNNNVTINRNVTINQRPVVWHHDGRFAGGRGRPGQPEPGRSPQPHPMPQNQPAYRDDHPRPPAPAAMPPAQRQVIEQDRQRDRQIRAQDAERAQQARMQQQHERQQQRDAQRQAQQRQQQEQQRQAQQQAREQMQAQHQQMQQRQQHEQQARQPHEARQPQEQPRHERGPDRQRDDRHDRN